MFKYFFNQPEYNNQVEMMVGTALDFLLDLDFSCLAAFERHLLKSGK